MKIIIEGNRYRFIIPLPIKVVLNDVTFPIMASYLKKYSKIPLKKEYLKIITKELINAKSSFGKLALVDVSSSDGYKIKITL